MIKQEQQNRVNSYFEAYARLLVGSSGRQREFLKNVPIIVSGAPPQAIHLLQFSKCVRASGNPVLWVHHSRDMPQLPQIGLVAHGGDQVYFIESCMLWMSPKEDRASLIPDSFEMGAFRFDDQLQLHHTPKAPARSFKAAEAAMARAYRKLHSIALEIEQHGAEASRLHQAVAA